MKHNWLDIRDLNNLGETQERYLVMTRPSLVVGLGGTGQWVLTWLKRDLLLSNSGRLPNNIHLLAIDTETQLETGNKRVNSTGHEENGIDIGGVQLDSNEFIYIGGDAKPIAERVRRGDLPQVGNWFPAQQWLDTQSPAAFILDDGAGRIRQFGRLAVFKDMISNRTNSTIRRAIDASLHAVKLTTQPQRRLEIILIGSLAGGTGSGIFIDIALILRTLAQEHNIHHILRGFFALPSVFTNTPDDDMKAKTFAAWRELNRFMITDSDFSSSPIDYFDDRHFQTPTTQRIFDACYLIDGKRQDKSLTKEPQYGAFPMIAEAVSAILDEQAGAAYTQQIFTNLAPLYSLYSGTPLYSTIGTYTLQRPAYFSQEISSYEFGQNILLRLLQPRKQPDEFERLVASGVERHLNLTSPDKNEEDPGMSGYARAPQFFTQPVSHQDNTSEPSLFMDRIATMNSQVKEGDQARVVEDMARSGSFAKAQAGWAKIYPVLGADPDFDAIRKEIMTQMNYNPLSLSRRDKESAEEVRNRIRGLRKDVRARFGGIVTSDEGTLEYFGQFGEVLEKVEQAHLLIFRRHIRLKLTEILMGKSENAIIARSGKLGYAWSFFNGVADELDDFLDLVDFIQKKREELRPELKLKAQALQAEKIMQEMVGKKFLLLWESPKVQQSENNYLRIMTRLVDVRREEILLTYVRRTAQMMRRMVEEARDRIKEWIWYLATGDDYRGLPGLWDSLRNNKQFMKSALAFDRQIQKIQHLLEDEEILASEIDLENALSNWEWEVDYEKQYDSPCLHVKVKLKLDSGSLNGVYLENPITSNMGSAERFLVQNNKNTILIMRLARSQSLTAKDTKTIAEALKEKYPSPSSLSNVLFDSTSPLTNIVPKGSPLSRSNFIRVMVDEDEYFRGSNGLEGELRQLNHLSRSHIDDSYPIQISDSENPYKLSSVLTLDLFRYDHFTAWHECLDAYARHIIYSNSNLLDPALLHNFPSEINAVYFEKQLVGETQQRYQPLHPHVVMLLEDPSALRQFLYLAMMGLITEKEENEIYRWELNWEKDEIKEIFWLTSDWNAGQHGGVRIRPTIIDAMHGYIIKRQSQQPGHNLTIDMDFASRLTYEAFKRVEDEIALIEGNMANNGFSGWLKSQALDPDKPSRVVRQDLADLSQVVELIFNSRLNELFAKTAAERGRQRGESFSAYWKNIEDKLIETDVRKSWNTIGNHSSEEEFVSSTFMLAQRIARSLDLPLCLHKEEMISRGRLVATAIDFTEALQETPIQNRIPLLFLQGKDLFESDLDDLLYLKNQVLSEPGHVSFVVLFVDDIQLIEAQRLLNKRVKKTYASDIIPLNYKKLLNLIKSPNPQKSLRQLVLSNIDLSTISPFNIKGATPDKMFFGRENELREISEHIKSASYAIIGGRRVGKTSMLRRLHRVLLPTMGFHSIYHDCSRTRTRDEFLAEIIRYWQPEKPEHSPRTFGELLHSEQQIFDQSALPLIILLDEADKLVPTETGQDWYVFDVLRSMANGGEIQVVLTGEQTLRDSLQNSFSPLFNFTNELVLKPLSFDAVRELVTKPIKQLEIHFDNEVTIVQHIWEFTSGHPSIVQSLCRRLIELLNKRNDRTIFLDDVISTTQDIQFIRSDFLATYFSKSTVLEHLAALIMAKSRTTHTLTSIHNELQNHEITVQLTQTDAALERLVDLRNLLVRTEDGYDFSVRALPEVLSSARRLEDLIALRRVVYQEFGDIPPEAAPPELKGQIW